jgi:hypothetical protein
MTRRDASPSRSMTRHDPLGCFAEPQHDIALDERDVVNW